MSFNIHPEFCQPTTSIPVRLRKQILALVDLDGDPGEELEYPIGLAEHYDADLWLMAGSTEPPIGPDFRGFGCYLRANCSHRDQVRLWNWVLQARKRHYRTFPFLACGGNYTEQVVRAARELQANFLVVRADGHGHGFASLSRSVADALVRRAGVPIFVSAPRRFSQLTSKEQSVIK